MTGYEMVGNLATLHLLEFLKSKNAKHRVNIDLLGAAMKIGY